MQKIKILQFPIANTNGGVTRYAINTWKYVNHERFECDFGTLSKRLDIEREICASGSKVHYISCYAEENPDKFAEELRKVLVDGNYDIVHLHTSFWKSFIAEEVAKACGIKRIIVHSHNTGVSSMENVELMHQNQKRHNQLKKMFKPDMATDFWACSEAAADWLFGEQIPRDRIRIVKDAIDEKRFAYNPGIRKYLRNAWGIDNRFVIGHIGRFSYQKNQEYLINLLYALKERRKNVMLLLEGKGSTKNAVVEQAKSLKLEEDIIFLEDYRNIEELYQVMDIFAFPSRFEGFGRVLLEAQCSGLMCFASDRVPNYARVTDHVMFLPLENPSVWTDWIDSVTVDGRQDQSDNIRKSGFSIAENIAELERLYSDR